MVNKVAADVHFHPANLSFEPGSFNVLPGSAFICIAWLFLIASLLWWALAMVVLWFVFVVRYL